MQDCLSSSVYGSSVLSVMWAKITLVIKYTKIEMKSNNNTPTRVVVIHVMLDHVGVLLSRNMWCLYRVLVLLL